MRAMSPTPSLRAKRSNPAQHSKLDCFVAALLAMTSTRFGTCCCHGEILRSDCARESIARLQALPIGCDLGAESFARPMVSPAAGVAHGYVGGS